MDKSMNPALILSPVFAGIGALFLLIIYLIYRRRKAIIAKGHDATGKVVDVITSRGSKGSTNYRPVIEYKPYLQGSITRKYPFTSTSNSYKKGDEVDIYYDPDKPERFVIKNDKIVKSLFWVLGILGGVFLLLGLITWNLRQQFLTP